MKKQVAVKTKKDCFKNWQNARNEENFKSYKCAIKKLKRTVRVAKMKGYDDFYTRLDTRDGEKYIYKLAKARERKTRDITQARCIKIQK